MTTERIRDRILAAEVVQRSAQRMVAVLPDHHFMRARYQQTAWDAHVKAEALRRELETTADA